MIAPHDAAETAIRESYTFILVVDPDPTSRRDAQSTLKVISTYVMRVGRSSSRPAGDVAFKFTRLRWGICVCVSHM